MRSLTRIRVSAIQQHFWKRWSSEYLHELQQRVKWTKNKTNIKEGDLVLVAEDNIPSKSWLIGRVSKVIADCKGIVRVADVKTKNGEIRRAVHKLAPIPKENLCIPGYIKGGDMFTRNGKLQVYFKYNSFLLY